MPASSLQVESIPFRKFNQCPHCASNGEQSLLCRLREGIPMISRSDGKAFHLLLADCPASYPAEINSPGTPRTSVCFWYSHVLDAGSTCSSVVILPDSGRNHAGLFRSVEMAADLMTKLLASCYRPPTLCELVNDSLLEVAH